MGGEKTEKWGPVYQEIMRSTSLSVEAKAIYAYLSSIAGADGSCYPSIETMQKELNMGKNRLTKHMGQLTSSGIIEKVRERNGNIYGRNRYILRHTQNEAVENQAVEFRPVENEATTENSITENSIFICSEQDPDPSGILLPLVDKTVYDVPFKITTNGDAIGHVPKLSREEIAARYQALPEFREKPKPPDLD